MRRSILWFLPPLATLLGLIVLSWYPLQPAVDAPALGKSRHGGVRAEVVAGSPDRPAAAGPRRASGFSEPVQLGFDVGDGWEPAVAADRFGHVYMVYSQYGGVPGCPDCTSPSNLVQVSDDGGQTWGSPRLILPGGSHPNDGQWDPQVVVDPVDGMTVYVSWMQNFKDDIAVAKSLDFGQTWTVTIADSANSINDKPILLARGDDVYVAYSQLAGATIMWFSSSHDGGETWSSVKLHGPPGGLPLPSGGTITSDGTVYFAWGSYKKPGQGSGEILLYLTRSTDGGATWEEIPIDNAWAGPECLEPCGWSYLSSQIVVASDEDDDLYVLWDGSDAVGDPGRMYFARSTDGGATWSPRVDVSTAAAGVNHNFPAIAARGGGEVAIAWMDARSSGPFTQTRWNTYVRTSGDGGQSFSAEAQASSFVTGYGYVHPEGFAFPYGDYFELDFDGDGDLHVVWGAGESYFGAGDVWYSRGG